MISSRIQDKYGPERIPIGTCWILVAMNTPTAPMIFLFEAGVEYWILSIQPLASKPFLVRERQIMIVFIALRTIAFTFRSFGTALR